MRKLATTRQSVCAQNPDADRLYVPLDPYMPRRSQEEVAQLLGCTKQNVAQIERKALRKLAKELAAWVSGS